MTLSPRDKWGLTVAPTVVVVLVYIWFVQGRLAEEVKGQNERLETLKAPAGPAPKAAPKVDIDKLRGERDQLTQQQNKLQQSVRDRQTRIREAEMQTAADESSFNPVAVPALFGEIAERHKVRLLKESEAELSGDRGAALILAAVAAPKSKPTPPLVRPAAPAAPGVPAEASPSAARPLGPNSAEPRLGPPRMVRLLRLDGDSPNLSATVAEILQRLPEAVPLALELNFNPDPDGHSRLLELWIMP